MRVDFVLDVFDSSRGGTERYLSRLARELSIQGHLVHVHCLQGEAPPGVQLRRVSLRSRLRGRREREFAERAAETARRERTDCLWGVRHVLDADVYQPHGGTWAASVEGRDRARRPGRLQRLARRAASRHRYFAEADREVFVRHPGLRTLAVSEMVRSDVLARYGAFGPRVEVVWPAVEVERLHSLHDPKVRSEARRRLGLGARTPVLAFVGHDFVLKGLGCLLESLRISPSLQECVLLVAGRGSRGFARQVRRLDLKRTVRMLGRTDVPQVLAAADALVHPTWYDPCALVTLEALAAGVPVVTTAFNGAAALIGEQTGRVVSRPDDAGRLAQAIHEVLARGRIASTATNSWLTRLSWARHVQRVIGVLESGG